MYLLEKDPVEDGVNEGDDPEEEYENTLLRECLLEAGYDPDEDYDLEDDELLDLLEGFY